jgi:AcrR family transcriptional regulator
MSPRAYNQHARAEQAAQTRRRIVEATHQLHIEKGVAATTFRDIAQRADVGIGTVFHHFPTYEDVIAACGVYTLEAVQPPTPGLVERIADPKARIRYLVSELFDFHARTPWMSRIRAERDNFAALDRGLDAMEAMRKAFIYAALQPLRHSIRTQAFVNALLDFPVYESLVDAGLTHAAAIEEMTQLLVRRLIKPRRKG